MTEVLQLHQELLDISHSYSASQLHSAWSSLCKRALTAVPFGLWGCNSPPEPRMFPTLFRGACRGAAGLHYCSVKGNLMPQKTCPLLLLALRIAKDIVKPFHILQILR